MLMIFGWNFEIWAVQKYSQRRINVNLVDPIKSFPTSIYLQKSPSIQPRMSLSKFGGKFNSLFIRPLQTGPPTRARFRVGLLTAEQANAKLLVRASTVLRAALPLDHDGCNFRRSTGTPEFREKRQHLWNLNTGVLSWKHICQYSRQRVKCC